MAKSGGVQSADHLALHRQDVGLGRLADLVLLAQHLEILAVVDQDTLGGLDLQPGRGDGDGFGGDAADQRQARFLELPALKIGLGPGFLDGARRGAEQIDHVAGGRADREKVRAGAAARRGEATRAVALNAGIETDLRPPGGGALLHHLLGLPQGGLGRLEGGVVGQRLGFGAVQGGAVEQDPPIGPHRTRRHMRTLDAGLLLVRHLGEIVAGLGGVGRRLVIWPDGAGRQ